MMASIWRGGSFYKRIVASLIVLLAIALITFGISTVVHRLNASTLGVYNPRVAERFEHLGVMSRPEYGKYCVLYAQLSKGKGCSDQDIDWITGLTAWQPQPSSPPSAAPLRHDAGLELLEADIKYGHPTAAQRDKIFNAVIPLLADKDTTGLDAVSATDVLRVLNDKRAIPLILPLVNSQNPYVRMTAQNSLKAMGYNPGT